MSDEIDTLVDSVYIHSVAIDGKFHLTARRGGEDIRERKFPYSEYAQFLRGIWENYLDKGEKPKLLGYEIPDMGLVDETLHCIAPASFSAPGNPHGLPDYRESLAYWLKSNSDKIKATIDAKSVDCLNTNLDGILKTHLERSR